MSKIEKNRAPWSLPNICDQIDSKHLSNAVEELVSYWKSCCLSAEILAAVAREVSSCDEGLGCACLESRKQLLAAFVKYDKTRAYLKECYEDR